MIKTAHTIAGDYCTVCHETAEWLDQTGQACHRIVRADEVCAGDYMMTTNNGGRQGSSIAVGSVSQDGPWTILHTALTAFRIPSHDTVYLW